MSVPLSGKNRVWAVGLILTLVVVLIPQTVSSGGLAPQQFSKGYQSAPTGCTLFKQVSNNYCWIGYPTGLLPSRVSFLSVEQSGALIGLTNQYVRIFSNNITGIVPSSGFRVLSNMTDFRLNQSAIVQLGMTVHFRSDSVGNCPPTGAKITLQNATGLTQVNPWTNLISVPIDCNAGTSLWDSFANGITPCSSFLGLLAGAFDCFENSTKILSTVWGNNPCTGNQQNCPEPFFNGQFFRLILTNGDGTTTTFFYSVDLTITFPDLGAVNIFSAATSCAFGFGNECFVIELIWTDGTSFRTVSTNIIVATVVTCPANLTFAQC